MTLFTPDTLPPAIASLFTLNHHRVNGPIKINGAEIDLVATPIGNPFAPKIYIEATVEYVDNTKYGKDLTKLAMVRESDPTAVCLIVSAKGFTADVKERARVTRIETLTYEELFARFEKFEPYVSLMLGGSRHGKELRALASIYEPPHFVDSHGDDDALTWMDKWLADVDASKSWLLVVGEYGTGKSALTKMLQKRWLEAYSVDPSAPIPVRIELGAFTKQFDAQGLLHHFLDRNGLGHVPIDFFWSLVRSGRVVLILDGYDEMAQYLTQRERRSTLGALAELSSDGVRGLITSRPNYFSETEQLALFDHLYKQLSLRSKYAAAAAEIIERRELEIDNLIQRSILDKYERSLKDLSPEQSTMLVRNMLKENPTAAETVIGILDRVFRTTGEGAEIALSGKPVIISYLIEVAGTLQDASAVKLSEWDVYTLIVDKLALRDLEQTTHVGTDDRRTFLQNLALSLSKTGQSQVNEEEFRAVIEKVFRSRLRRRSGTSRAAEIDSMFEDLRRSGTLTRSAEGGDIGWRFSHNSLREFLVAEMMIEDILQNRTLRADPPISDAMRAFAASSGILPDTLAAALARTWSYAESNPAVGSYLTLVWDALSTRLDGSGPLEAIAGSPPRAERLHLSSIAVSSASSPQNYRGGVFRDCTIFDVSFNAADLADSTFDGSLLEAVSFEDADLSGCSFVGSVLVDVFVSGANFEGATFADINDDISLILEGKESSSRIEGRSAIGYLSFIGASIDNVEPYFIWMHHPRFPIVYKIAKKLIEGGQRQRRGLEQRGEARSDPRFARLFVKKLESLGYVHTPSGRPEQLEITPEGRAALGQIVGGHGMPPTIVDFLAGS